MHFPKTETMPRLAWLIAICQFSFSSPWRCLFIIIMNTSSASRGSASDRHIVEISNLTKVVDQRQSEPIPAHCVTVYKGFESISVCFILKPTSEIALF